VGSTITLTDLGCGRMVDAVELFHGPGGWAEGLKLVAPELLKVGVEWDDAAVATARAAGHDVARADVSELNPLGLGLALRPGGGLIASPPCPGFSAAGKGLGRKDLPRLLEMVREWSPGPVARGGWHDERSALTLEVVRWCAAVRPAWVALEQVKEVLPVWEAVAEQLRARGYSVWSGLVYAERYGVPQTRVRAVLIASLLRRVGEPRATHRRYYPVGHRLRDAPSLEEAGLPRWVSMADALGWGMTERPFPVLASSRTTGGPDKEKVGGSARRILYDEQESGRWAMRANAQGNAAVRGVGEPAPTIKGGHDSGDRVWVHERPSPTVVGSRRSEGGMLIGRQLPAGEDRSRGGWSDVEGAPRNSGTAVRVSIEEAAVLQSFRRDYPWQGTKTKRFQQVGNAVPPLLAAAVLGEVLGLPVPAMPHEPVDAEGD
jgi:DNA (cytosine-5)-methyltransferase 1